MVLLFWYIVVFRESPEKYYGGGATNGAVWQSL